MLGVGSTGYTYATQLQNALWSLSSTQSEVRQFAPDDLPLLVTEAVSQGFPLILLNYNRLDQPASGHWVVAIGYATSGLTIHNPWGGREVVMSWSEAIQWSKGSALLIQRTRSL